MKILWMAWKFLRELWREPQLFWVYLLFPAAMIGLYFYAFGKPASALASSLHIAILDQDGGDGAASLIANVRDQTYEGENVFDVRLVNNPEEVAADLAEHKIIWLMEIPPGFTKALQAGQPESTQLIIRGDPQSDLYALSRSFIMLAIDQMEWEGKQSVNEPVLTYEFIEGTGTLTDFQFGVPGMAVFGVLFGVIGSALILIRETSGGTLQRLRLARLTGLELLGGVTLALSALTAVQLFIAYGVALFCNFQSYGIGSLGLALGICLLLSTAASGMGMLAAAFTRTEGDATNLATGIMMVLVFLSGAVFPIPGIPLLTLSGQTIGVYDLLPSTHAAEAMRRVMIYGDGVNANSYSLIALTTLSLVYLGLGAWFYQKRRLG